MSGSGPADNIHRSSNPTDGVPEALESSAGESLEYSSQVDSDSYLDIHAYGDAATSVTGNIANYISQHVDATDTVHEMHLALLYLLSNPDEFHRALATHPARGATTLAEWNAEYDNESVTEVDSLMTSSFPSDANNTATPLPFVVFADDAEVVLPQAHTASQLFGLERLEGVELEAAAGIHGISQLFLRWLALMPGGDHLNIIDPPGLTVMRIAGGRYRVTAAHRVVWTWMNEFVPLTDSATEPNDGSVNSLQVGDLVTMTIVDVFETDNQGKLLSYCPTFDNRAVLKTHQTAENIRKSSTKLLTMVAKARKSQTATILLAKVHSMADTVKQRVEEAVHQYHSPQSRISDFALPPRPSAESLSVNHNQPSQELASVSSSTYNEPALSAVEAAVELKRQRSITTPNYHGNDDRERHEV